MERQNGHFSTKFVAFSELNTLHVCSNKVPRSLTRLKVGLILVGLALAIWPLSAQLSPYFFFICIVLTGIPHGAIDHVFHRNFSQGPAWLTTVFFYCEYFFWIGAYAILWWLLPQVAILSFLLFSAYHFGQTQLSHLPIVTATSTRRLLQLAWGSWAVGSFVLCNSKVLDYGFTQIIPIGNVTTLDKYALPFVVISASVLALVLTGYLYKKPFLLFFELAEVATLSFVFLRNDFFTSFGLLFGGWHALHAIQYALLDVKRFEAFPLKQLAREALLHSVASLGGIAILTWAVLRWYTQRTPELWLFIAISVLAFPHIVMIERWYSFLSSTKRTHKILEPDGLGVQKPV